MFDCCEHRQSRAHLAVCASASPKGQERLAGIALPEQALLCLRDSGKHGVSEVMTELQQACSSQEARRCVSGSGRCAGAR